MGFRSLLVVLLVVASSAVLFATRHSLDTARALGDRALESTALALSSSVENALRARRSEPELRSILADRVVAYALIAGRDGTIRFHVNPDLVGTRLPASGPDAWRPPPSPLGRKVTLGLGTPAFQYDYPLRTAEGAPETLRLVLHLGAVDRLGAAARRLWVLIGGVLALLAGAGVALDRLQARMLALRDEMDRRERLSLIGQMTATLAHEIRNALWGVKGYAQWLDEKLAAESPGKSDVAAILQGAGRIEGLVDDLLLYAREESYRMEPVALGPVAAEACALATAGWGGSVRVDVDGVPAVRADREKLHRAVVNGVRNAVEAMPDGGCLTILAMADGGAVVLRVEDTGGGVLPEAEERLFVPFFTTKVDGTGLGLAYSRKVIEGMGGAIRLESAGRGAVLTLRLPRAEED